MTTAPDNHSKFLEHLNASVDGVDTVMEWLLSLGFEVTKKPSSKASSASDWERHIDGGDLFIQKRIEVKRLSIDFNDANDWPYGDHYIVCGQASFDNASPIPHAYITLNKLMNVCGVVMVESTHKAWWVERRIDSRYNGKVDQPFYFVKIDKVIFCNLNNKHEDKNIRDA